MIRPLGTIHGMPLPLGTLYEHDMLESWALLPYVHLKDHLSVKILSMGDDVHHQYSLPGFAKIVILFARCPEGYQLHHECIVHR